jgi:hypothetical protein
MGGHANFATAILHAVFDESLQTERGNFHLHQIVRYVDGVVQPVPKPGLLDLQIICRHLQFPLQPDGALARVVERVAKQSGKPFRHALRRSRVFRNQRHDGIQSIEQEVRAQTRLQGRKSRLSGLVLRPVFEGVVHRKTDKAKQTNERRRHDAARKHRPVVCPREHPDTGKDRQPDRHPQVQGYRRENNADGPQGDRAHPSMQHADQGGSQPEQAANTR